MNKFLHFVLYVLICAGLNLLFNPNDKGWVFVIIFFFVYIVETLLFVRTSEITVSATAIEVRGIFRTHRYVIKTRDGQILHGDKNIKLKPGKKYIVKTTYLLGTPMRDIISIADAKQPQKKQKTAFMRMYIESICLALFFMISYFLIEKYFQDTTCFLFTLLFLLVWYFAIKIDRNR